MLLFSEPITEKKIYDTMTYYFIISDLMCKAIEL